jgi:hypothetical protein
LAYLAGAGLIAFEAVAILILIMIGILAPLIPILIIPFVVGRLWIWKFIRGDRLRLTANYLVTTGGKHGGAVRYEDIQEVRINGARVEVKLREATGWWRWVNFAPGFRKFAIEGDPKRFLAEIEVRLGDVREYPLPEGGTALVRAS